MEPTDIRSAEEIARTGVRSAAEALLRAEHGPHALTWRPIAPGLSGQVEVPAEWRQGVAAACLVREHADRLAAEWVRAARGDGVPWADLAAPLRLRVGEGDSPAELAFEAVAPAPLRLFDTRVLRWTCGSCGQSVTDHGPYGGHPADREIGHVEDCARHRREIDAYEARQR